MREKWNSQFRAIDVEIEKDYDFNSLNGAFNFTNALTRSGLITLFQLPLEAYTDLVQIFYSNATLNEVIDVGTSDPYPWRDTGRKLSNSFTTYMFGQALEIMPDYLNQVLGLGHGGVRIPTRWDMSDAFVRVFRNPICQGESQSDHMRHLRQLDFPMIS